MKIRGDDLAIDKTSSGEKQPCGQRIWWSPLPSPTQDFLNERAEKSTEFSRVFR